MDRLLAQIEQSGSFDEAWTHLFQGPLQLGERATRATYRILPHVVAVAEKQDPASLREFWLQVAHIAATFNYPGKNCEPEPIPVDLDAAFRTALVHAESLALQCFAATEWGERASDLALACLALSHHPVGCLIWQGPSPPRNDGSGNDFVRFFCRQCGAEDIWFDHVGDGVAAVLEWKNPPLVPEPNQPSLQAPAVPGWSRWRRPSHRWGVIAAALDRPAGEMDTLCSRTVFPADFLGRFGEHLEVAAAVAKAGVPRETPNRAVLSLLGGMVALSGA